MYETFFQFTESPFNLTPDPRFFFASRKHEEALEHVRYGIAQRKGFMVVTGEVGTGKTTLSRLLLEKLDRPIRTSLIFNPSLNTTELLQAVNHDFGIPADSASKKDLVSGLNRFLLDTLAEGGNAVLIIDEGQNLSIECLEEIRMLSNLETEKDKLIQILLIGQPELREKLNQPELRQLNQRVAIRYHIEPLGLEEMEAYVAFRLRVAGGQDRLFFTPKALKKIHRNSSGVPRLVNLICDKALLGAFAQESRLVDHKTVDRALRELAGPAVPRADEDSSRREDALVSAGDIRPPGRISSIRWTRVVGGMAAGAALVGVLGFGIFGGGLEILRAAKTALWKLGTTVSSRGPSESAESAVLKTPPSDVLATPKASRDETVPLPPRPKEFPPTSVAAPMNAPVPASGTRAAPPPAASLKKDPSPASIPAPRGAFAAGFDSDGVYRVALPSQVPFAARITLLKVWGVDWKGTPGDNLGPDDEAFMTDQGFSVYRTDPDLFRIRALNLPCLVRGTWSEGVEGSEAVLISLTDRKAELLNPLGGKQSLALRDFTSRLKGPVMTFWRPAAGIRLPLGGGRPDPSVVALQKVFKARGLYFGPVDGILGPGTEGAIRFFQQKYGLRDDGVFGLETLIVLSRVTRAEAPRLQFGEL